MSFNEQAIEPMSYSIKGNLVEEIARYKIDGTIELSLEGKIIVTELIKSMLAIVQPEKEHDLVDFGVVIHDTSLNLDKKKLKRIVKTGGYLQSFEKSVSNIVADKNKSQTTYNDLSISVFTKTAVHLFTLPLQNDGPKKFIEDYVHSALVPTLRSYYEENGFVFVNAEQVKESIPKPTQSLDDLQSQGKELPLSPIGLTEEEIDQLPTEPKSLASETLSMVETLKESLVSSRLIKLNRRQHITSKDHIMERYEDYGRYDEGTSERLHHAIVNQVLPQQVDRLGRQFLNPIGKVIREGKVETYLSAFAHFVLTYYSNEDELSVRKVTTSILSTTDYFLKTNRDEYMKSTDSAAILDKVSHINSALLKQVEAHEDIDIFSTIAFLLDVLDYPKQVKELDQPITREDYVLLADIVWKRFNGGSADE